MRRRTVVSILGSSILGSSILGSSILGSAAAAAALRPAPAEAAPRSAAPRSTYPFQNPRLPLTVRVDDLVGRLTRAEKISLLHQSQTAIPRLDIPYFKAGTEALHGVAWSNDVNDNWNVVTAEGTVFPQAVGLASTWDPELIRRVGAAVGDEARGYHALDPDVWGLNLWAPVVNLLRDPRWGRNEEGYSEDPYLTGVVSTAYGAGMAGDDPEYLKAAPTLKHYLAYNTEARRDVITSMVPPRVLNEYDRAAFRPAIAANAATGVMASYNLVNGRPSTVNPDLAGLEQFRLEQQPDGSHVLRYAGYDTQESWWSSPTYLTVGADGVLALGVTTADGAAHFDRQVISSGRDSAVAAAQGADAAIVVVGSMPFINGREAHDRSTLALPAAQDALVQAVRGANPRTIVVLEDSYPTTMQADVPAVLWTTHAGAETGHAVADVLFGDHNSAGRLTQTWYRSDADLPPDLSGYDIIGSDQTYLYYQGTPLYPFGHGLSYTSFRYANLRATTGDDGAIRVSVEVTNTGERAGDEVVQLYTHQRASRDKQPIRQLRAFQRVHLAPGQTSTVRLRLPTADLAHWDVTRDRWVVETAAYDLLVGSSSTDIRQQATVQVDGEQIPPRDLATTTRAENFDAYSGIQLVDETKASGTAVGSVATGDWVGFRDAALPDGTATLTARVAKASAGTASIEVHLDSPTGPHVGTATVTSTGDQYEYATVSAPLAGAGRRHDVYLVFGPDIRLATFTVH